MKERRDAAQALAVRLRVAELRIKVVAEAGPPGRDAFQGSHPVGYSKDVDADVKNIRLKGQCGTDHVAAITTADNADARAIHPIETFQIAPAEDHILEIDIA